MRHAAIILLCTILFGRISPAQDVDHASRGDSGLRTVEFRDIAGESPPSEGEQLDALIESIRQGILSGEIQKFSGSFAHQVYITLRGKEGGYFSSNQALCILQNYFSGRRAVNFRFTTVRTNAVMPYATGGGTFLMKGNTEILQVYVAFASIDGQWVITQCNVY